MPENGDQASLDNVKSEPSGGGGGFSPHSTTTTPPQTGSSSSTAIDAVNKKRKKNKIAVVVEEEDNHSGPSVDEGSPSPVRREEDISHHSSSENRAEEEEEEADTGPLKQCLAAAIKLSRTISRQHAERMLQIIADLLMGTIETGEFQRRVQEVIRLPFRPLVPPLLDKQVPSLRKEIASQLMLARQNENGQQRQQQQTTEQVKSLLLDDGSPVQKERSLSSSPEETDSSVLSVWQVFQPTSSGSSAEVASSSSSSRKRRASASLVENGAGGGADGLMGTVTIRGGESTPKRPNVETARKNLMSVSSSSVWTPPKVAQQPPQVHAQQQQPSSVTMTASPPFRQGDEEWANIHTMLNCILSMVEKTRRALAILQQRSPNDHQITGEASQWHLVQQQNKNYPRRDAISSNHHHHQQQQQVYEASELRRQAGELIAQTLKATEDRVSQVKRKAEEAVHDVRRAAMVELQRALSAERLRAERLAAEARRQGAEETLLALGRHSQAKEVCWNCARRANETCSGCNIARYCSTFCQHKHWEIHHKICGRVSQLMLAAAAGGTVAATTTVSSGSVDRDPLTAGNSPTDLRNASSSKPTSPHYSV